MLDPKAIGHRIKMLRVEKDMTQAEMANIIKCSPYKISEWENGKLLISSSYLYKVSNLFGVCTDYIMTGRVFQMTTGKETQRIVSSN
jgi:transcriptional regulator with XRE-family HTH domain